MNSSEEIIGNSKEISRIRHKIKQASDSQVSILLEGESGTGKDLLSRYCSSGGNISFYKKFDCEILESSASTNFFMDMAERSAEKNSQSIANYTWYLDHIEDLNMALQANLLSFLESPAVIRSEKIKIQIRVISSTSVELKDRVRDGKFREDLYYRISGVKLMIPPLRERKEDIPFLISHFLKMYSLKFEKKQPEFSADVLNLFQSHYWHGNVRQLEMLISGILTLHARGTISLKNLPEEFFTQPVISAGKELNVVPGIAMKTYEKEIIRKNLMFVNGNRAKAAILLGISERNLYRKLIEFGMQ
ncbi:MAG: sigma 54-interacting transcriptional regulator [Leptospira sp.]|nr:sigma 54-interacting transcriptional regulator [Leptospira sp.]